MIALILPFAALAVWLYLVFGRGGFWRARERDDGLPPSGRRVGENAVWPAVVAVVPARNEAEVIGDSVGSLLRQTYRGDFRVYLVDDQSGDGTARLAQAAAQAIGADERLVIIAGRDLPSGWTGKLWAMRQGLVAIEARADPAAFVLFCDADIAHAPDVVERLVAGSLARGTVLTSLMAKLGCDSAAERWLVPAFIFFFQKLYPFAFVNDPGRAVAAAAGGCMLVDREALRRAGGLGAIRQALIDDCALAALMKGQGPIWLGLTERVRSLRPYPRLDDIRRMVVRSAFAELRYSPWRLGGAIAGMGLTYAVPPLAALFGHGLARTAGLGAWALMVLAFAPTLRFYRLSAWRGLALPAIATVYTAFTIESAWLHWAGRGGAWKGRYQAKGRTRQA